MKTIQLFFIVTFLFVSTHLGAQVLTGAEAEKQVRGSEVVLPGVASSVPKYVKFKEASAFSVTEFPMWASTALGMSKESAFKLLNASSDKLGFTHYRYMQYFNNIPVEGTMYILHTKNEKVISMNGELLPDISTGAVASVNESNALSAALNSVHATLYKWQIPAEENFLKSKDNNPAATYYPKGELVYVSAGKLKSENMRLAWKFDVYAQTPLSRDYVYVDALTGEVLLKKDRIHTTDTPGTAITAYSGTRTIITDSFSGGYRLQETGRGGGIRTFNIMTGTNYNNAVDFTDADNTWNNVNAQLDQYATDAHWGAEMTYDYYWLMHNRNSVDDSGMRLDSYVHYDVGMANAFWDGNEMNYGDGNGTSNPFTALDITGHEITHGVTQFTSNLDYQDESGALNESFSDIFGTCIEWYARPTNANWLMGSDIGITIRNMANPNSTGDPDTYQGNNWYTGFQDNGGVHTNSNVQNFWFYLLCQGGTGTNDIGDSYNVTGIGMTNAGNIAFRTNTVYLTSTSQYADSRFYSIMSAIDLFGACTPEVIATTNAWYAVGVGGAFVYSVNAAFTANVTSGCSVPFTVNFTNGSSNAGTYLWNFGDATTSTQTNPSHAYTSFGTYTVTLISDGGACGSDTAVQTSLVTITDQSPTAAGANICNGASATLNATGQPTISWYANPTGGSPLATGSSFTTPPLNTNTTYYIESAIAGPSGYVGPPDTTLGPGGNHNNTSTQYLTFNVMQACTLKTAVVYATGAGNRDFELWDGSGNSIQTYTVNVPNNGYNLLTLNIPLAPGSYRIGGTQMNLYRNSGGAVFPYPLAGLVNITGSSATGRYYYLYHWDIETAPCVTVRNPVPVTVMFQNQAGFTYTNVSNNYNFTSSSTSATSWQWDFGDGSPLSTSQNPAHTYVSPTGTYTVTLIVSDGTCSDTSTQQVHIVNGVAELSGSISSLYPNPATNELYITTDVLLENYTIEIYDVIGQKVFSQKSQIANSKSQTSINISDLQPGIYNIQILSESKRVAGRFVKE